jgi:Transcriptional regulator, AbiEi antitoxin
VRVERLRASIWGVGNEPSRGSKLRDTPPFDARLAALAGRQHGLVTAAQLARAGLGYAAVSNRAGSGRLHRKYRGVYAVGQPRLSKEGEWMAAVLACGEGAALSHLSAAVHWRIWRRRVTGIDVLAPRNRHLPGVRVHKCRRLDPRDITTRGHIPVTTVARTLEDLTDVLTPRGRVPQTLRRARHPRRDGSRQRPPPPARAGQGACAERCRQRRHAQRQRGPLPLPHCPSRPATTAREHEGARHRDRRPRP